MSEPIRIFVGCAGNNEDLESQMVLEYSLRKHSARDLDIVWMMQSRDPQSFWHGWNTVGWATPFSGFRWGVPAYCNYQGRAIYLDSDMIAMDDIGKLWDMPIPQGVVAIAKPQSERFCCTLFDNAAIRGHILPIETLKIKQGAHREVRKKLSQSPLVHNFAADADWNVCDGGQFTDISDARIKIHHYTAIECQPHLRFAIPRLGTAGQSHWFTGKVKRHWRRDLVALFDYEYEMALAADNAPEQYMVEPFGKYPEGGSYGGAYATNPTKARQGR